MPSASPPSERFWLLTGEVPSGPFTVDQIHAKIASGDATWQTPACPVGGSTWLPLVQTSGIGPSAPLPPVADTRSPDAHPPSAPSAPAPPVKEPVATVSLEGVFGAKSPASASRPTPVPGTAQPAAQNGQTEARQDQPQASAKPLQPNQSNRFWLLVGTEATGPYRAAHIRAMVQSGELSPDAKARRVGTEVWVPLTEAVGALPPPPPAGSNPVAADSGTNPPTPPAPGRTSLLQTVGLHPQVVQVGIGVLLLAGFLGLAKSCKEDAKNQPSLQDRLKEQRNKNPLPPVPPPKTAAQPE